MSSLHLRAAASLVARSAELSPLQVLKYLHIESVLMILQVAACQVTYSSDSLIRCRPSLMISESESSSTSWVLTTHPNVWDRTRPRVLPMSAACLQAPEDRKHSTVTKGLTFRF